MKEKKTIIILILVLTIGIVGLTIAYFANSSSVDNVFTTQPYGTTVTENFTSPSNWLPGDTTNKTVIATNTGNVDEAVRISLSESWVTANHGTLNGWITVNGNKSSHLPENEPSTDERVAVINFDNSSDWTYNNGYYYYNYKLAPNESTSSLIKSVTFNSKTKLDDTCVETPTATGRTITCNSSGDDYDDATYTLTFNIETVQYNKYVEAWGTSVAIAEEKPQPAPTGVEYLTSTATNAVDAEYTNETKGKMFTFTHTVNGNIVNESRYIGDAPNNYVYFNCTDDSDTSTCEVWRIIGVFDVERNDPSDSSKTITETRMKLVRGSDFAEEIAWDSNVINDWSNASLKTYLNGTYYSSLSQIAQSQIGDAIYYLGGRGEASSEPSFGTTEEIYAWERGTEVYSGRPTSWEGKVAIMYPSDMYMTYAKGVNNTCYTNPYYCNTGKGGKPKNSWVYNTNVREGQTSQQWTWFLSPDVGDLGAFSTLSDGGLESYPVNYFAGGRPVVYLKSDIQITDGDGSSNNPYKLQ